MCSNVQEHMQGLREMEVDISTHKLKKTDLETKRSHDALVDGERGIGPDLHECILAEAQILKAEIALPEAQL